MEANYLKLENNEEFLIIGCVENNNNKYIILTKEDNPSNIQVRKVITESGKDYFTKLDSIKEVGEVLNKYYETYKGEK